MPNAKPELPLEQRARSWSPEDLANLIAHGINHARAAQSRINTELCEQNATMRAELESLRAELRAIQAKQAGGALTLARR